jgi:hypothetical protein
VDRRRGSYLALVFGGGSVTPDGELVEDLRETMGARVRELLGLPASAAPVTRLLVCQGSEAPDRRWRAFRARVDA